MQKRKVVIIFILSLFIRSIVFSQNFGFPVPAKTNLASKANQEISGSQFDVYQYSSLLTQSEILQFYQQNLGKKGWEKMALPMVQDSRFLQDRVYNFVKGDEMLVLNFSPLKAGELIFYSISLGEFPKVKDSKGQESQPLDVVKKPKPLESVPIYPGSKQIDYRKTPSGLQAGYMASGGIEAVKGFYLQKMPQQGWKLSEEKSVGSDQYDLSKVEESCPTCPKISLEAKEAMQKIDMQGVSLDFRQEGKTCLIFVTQMENLEGVDLTSLGLGDTIITVVYHDEK